MKITGLFTYPIKSCAGLAHQEFDLEARGPRDDRRWMIVSDIPGERGHFLTQREHSTLAVVQPSLTAECLILNAPGMSEIALSLTESSGTDMKVVVWGDDCQATDMGREAAEWLSAYLGTAVRLVRMNDEFVRPVDPTYAKKPSQTSFTDGFPMLLISEGSLNNLNERLTQRGKSSIPMTRFRPNVIVNGCEPFAEDTWNQIHLGEIACEVVKPCGRCATTTVDQTNGTIPDVKEPLATLATFRKAANGKVMFGQNVIHRALGSLKVGDSVQVFS